MDLSVVFNLNFLFIKASRERRAIAPPKKKELIYCMSRGKNRDVEIYCSSNKIRDIHVTCLSNSDVK